MIGATDFRYLLHRFGVDCLLITEAVHVSDINNDVTRNECVGRREGWGGGGGTCSRISDRRHYRVANVQVMYWHYSVDNQTVQYYTNVLYCYI